MQSIGVDNLLIASLLPTVIILCQSEKNLFFTNCLEHSWMNPSIESNEQKVTTLNGDAKKQDDQSKGCDI